MSERGVVYIASQEPYLSEAVQSAESVREHHDDLPITLYAPETVDVSDVFDDVRTIEDPSHDFADSNLSSEHMPFEQNLFLDSDTYVTGSLEPVFALLDQHDLAAAQDPTRTGTVDHPHKHDIPETFPQYNTGVVAYRDCESVRSFFDRWHKLYETVDAAHGLNQPTFRMALYEVDIELATLPPEWNFRIGNVANNVLYACGPVRILHGRSMHWEIPDAAARVNATTERRAVVAKPHPELITESDRTLGQAASYAADRGHWSLVKNGPVSSAKTIASMFIGKIQ